MARRGRLEKKPESPADRIFIIEDDPTQSTLMRYLLQGEGYQVDLVADGALALSQALVIRPNLVLLDVMLPNVDGYTICRSFREEPLLRHTPVVMLTAKASIADRIAGLRVGADGYITKPFELEELLLTVQHALEKARLCEVFDPLSHLPGRAVVKEVLNARLGRPDIPWAVLQLDIDRLKAFNDYYGYAVGDELIKELGGMVRWALERHGSGQDFAGHLGGDDFVVVSIPERVDALCRELVAAFDTHVSLQYNANLPAQEYNEDQRRASDCPLTTLSIAATTSCLFRGGNRLALVDTLGQLIKAAKAMAGSKYIIDDGLAPSSFAGGE